MEKFKELGLSKELLKALHESGFENPTEIQEKTIPLALAGKDILGGSATGSGKTLAFSSAIIDNLRPNGHVQALILTPTRELAEQVSDSIKKFSRNIRLEVSAVYGGINMENQIRKMRHADVIVGTPGRILDHLNRRTLSFREVKFLVLDEVDRMFDMGFHNDVEKIIKECPTDRQTMMFSATISADVAHLAKKYTRNPIEISVESYIDPSMLEQIYYDVDDKLKFSLLVHLLKKENADLVMVFCGTRRNVDFVASNLAGQGINAKAIHGGMAQNKRISTLNDFHKKGVGVLVCTDVAARGLDIKGITHVYNYDLPKTSQEYIHRIGRTARAGKEGKAISILGSRDYDNFNSIQQDEFLKIKPVEVPQFEKVWVRLNSGRERTSRFGGGRPTGGRLNRDTGFRGNRGNRGSRGGRNERGSRGNSKFGRSGGFNKGRR